MGGFLSKLKIIFTLLPLILEAVKAVEVIIPLPSSGKAKLDLILQIADQIWQSEKQVQAEYTQKDWAGLISSVAGIIVSILNSTGVFKKAVI